MEKLKHQIRTRMSLKRNEDLAITGTKKLAGYINQTDSIRMVTGMFLHQTEK